MLVIPGSVPLKNMIFIMAILDIVTPEGINYTKTDKGIEIPMDENDFSKLNKIFDLTTHGGEYHVSGN